MPTQCQQVNVPLQDGICDIKDRISILGAGLPRDTGSYMHPDKYLLQCYWILLSGSSKCLVIWSLYAIGLHLMLIVLMTAFSSVLRIHNNVVFSLVDSRTKTWEGDCGIYMCCCGIHCHWCCCWYACFGWRIALITNCSPLPSAWMVN